MKKLLFLFLLFVAAVPMSTMADEISSPPTCCKGEQLPPPLPVPCTTQTFCGTWVLGFSGGTSMEPDGAQMALQYSEMAIEISSLTEQGDGVFIYNGKVAGYSNSSITMIYQPARSTNFIEMSVFIPVGMFPGAPAQDYFTMNNKLYIAPNGNIMGIMAAEWNNAYTDNRVNIEIMFHSNVNMFRQNNGGKG